MAKKKKNGLSAAIIVLNILIVGIIVLLIVLIYLYMKDDAPPEEETTTTTAISEGTTTETDSDFFSSSDAAVIVSDTSETTDAEVLDTSETTESDEQAPAVFNKSFFDNDMFIGDSISTGLYLYEYLDKENVFAEVGLNPLTAVTHEIDGETSIERATAMQPEHIYIMLGTNGLASLDASYMASEMINLIAELEIACPTADIYIISIPPVTAAHDALGNETMQKVTDYNTRLQSLCSEGGYGFIDICAAMLDADGYFSAEYAEEDGLHFLGTAYAKMLSMIQNAVEG